MFRILSIFLLILSQFCFAQGAVQFKSLREARAAGIYRITCSDTSGIQAHIFLEMEQGKLVTLKMVTIANAESLKIIEFSRADLDDLRIKETANELTISGHRPGAYLDEEIDFTLSDRSRRFLANLDYDDHDGMGLRRENMSCGVVNYILSPSK